MTGFIAAYVVHIGYSGHIHKYKQSRNCLTDYDTAEIMGFCPHWQWLNYVKEKEEMFWRSSLIGNGLFKRRPQRNRC